MSRVRSRVLTVAAIAALALPALPATATAADAAPQAAAACAVTVKPGGAPKYYKTSDRGGVLMKNTNERWPAGTCLTQLDAVQGRYTADGNSWQETAGWGGKYMYFYKTPERRENLGDFYFNSDDIIRSTTH
ncbi:hypothetical protein ACN20G_28660 (plasmid) [Streptomyces sp. BI20]|uniref:hypothetical protein n=1 Tax=Streptomyces sp. BI20 TaxID=3403460 RepID=UPI003C747CFA